MKHGAVLVLACLAICGCGPRRVSTSAPLDPSLVVLLADPDTGGVGHATVSITGGTVELAADRDATTVSNAQATPVAQLAPADVTRIFGGALASLPMPPAAFTLYFRLESDDLTPESQADLPRVLSAVAGRPAPDVAVVGHTDTSGDARRNYTLGLDRAVAVRALLTGAGIEASLIEVSSHGEVDPIVQTADNALEPRNRRVEISVR